MIIKTITIQDPAGLHARPASQIVELAHRFKSSVMLRKGHTLANARSILQLMLLAVGPHMAFDLIVDGDDEKAAIVELQELLESPNSHHAA